MVDFAQRDPETDLPHFTFKIRGDNIPLARQPELILRSDLDLSISNVTNRVPVIGGSVRLRDSFYLATVNEDGWPYVQHRGGHKGFVHIIDPKTIGFADFRGNKQYISLGNLAVALHKQGMWTEAGELYDVASWGKGYFAVGPNGHVWVRPDKDPARGIDLKELVDNLQLRGISLPILIRFGEILKHRLGEMHQAFQNAIAEHNYKSTYCCVYPIKVNQQRQVVEEVLDFGRLAIFVNGEEADIQVVARVFEIIGVAAKESGLELGRPDDAHVAHLQGV
jgi:hypothetical protein